MLKALSKPRWLHWENLCLKLAFEQKIQLKIIAAALGKSVSSISKKIRKLGLRGDRSTPGRLKGETYACNWEEKIPQDIKKMRDILTQYAPHQERCKLQKSFHAGWWPPPAGSVKGSLPHPLQKESSSLSLSSPFNNVPLLEDESFKPIGTLHIPGEPLYISLRYVEEWAIAKGFHQVKNSLQDHGICYWKEGRYFSKAQLLVYVNGLRFEKKLEPLVVVEEEIGA